MLTAKAFREILIKCVGLPYVLGAEWKPPYTERPKALDCSEIVEAAYALNGTPIGDLAASQFDKTRALKSGESPQIGDLVFLRNNRARWNGIGHVAIISAKLPGGDYEIVEARGRKWGVVKTTLSYWKTRAHYTGVRRFPGFKLAPETVVPDKDRRFRLLWANRRAERWGGLPDNSRRPGQEMKALKPSIILGCEMSELARNITRDVLGTSWITWPQGMVWVTWDKKRWREKAHSVEAFGNNIHGWVSVTLESLKDNHRHMTVVAIHNRPKSSYPGYTDAQVVEAKRATIKSALDALPAGPVIVAIDANTEKAWDLFEKRGLVRFTDDVPTHGTHKIDAIWGTPDIVKRKSEFVNNTISDHKWGILDGTLPAIVNPNT